MTNKKKIAEFVEQSSGFAPEFSEQDQIKAKGKNLIWTYPVDSGIMQRKFFQMDKNKKIIKELKTQQKSEVENEWVELKG